MKIASPKLSFWERIYVVEVVKGMGVTLGHLLRNLFKQSEMPTVQFPEEPSPLAARHRSRHRLTVRENGDPKCVACMCCATACPARCIHIVAEESPIPHIEKRPAVFEIDLLRCVFCGYCVEACPEDAIRMDSADVLVVGEKREDFIVGMEYLLTTDDKLDVRHFRSQRGGRKAGGDPVPGTPLPPPEEPTEESLWEEHHPHHRPKAPAVWQTNAKNS